MSSIPGTPDAAVTLPINGAGVTVTVYALIAALNAGSGSAERNNTTTVRGSDGYAVSYTHLTLPTKRIV